MTKMLDRFSVAGHDWGARTPYTMAALFPERLSALAALSLGYQPRGIFKVPGFVQSKRFWYQWLLCIDGGAETVRRDPTREVPRHVPLDLLFTPEGM